MKLAIATIFSSPAKSKGSTHPAFPPLVTPHTVCPACKPHYVPKLLVTSCPYCISLFPLLVTTCVWRPVFPLLVTWSAGLPLGSQQVARPSNKRCEKYWAGSIYIHATPSGNKQWSPSGEMVSNKDANAQQATHRHPAGRQTHAALNACIVTCLHRDQLDSIFPRSDSS